MIAPRSATRALGTAALASLMALSAAIKSAGAAPPAASAVAKQATVPAEISLVDEGKAGQVYRESASSLRLYFSDQDSAGRSNCLEGCASAWPPVRAPASASPVGNWTIIARPDGTHQWAFKGKPVYTRFHDAPGQPTGEAIAGWHLLRYTAAP